jgi:hypothetical protein
MRHYLYLRWLRFKRRLRPNPRAIRHNWYGLPMEPRARRA